MRGRGHELTLREGVHVRLWDEAIRHERAVRERLGHPFRQPARPEHAGVPAALALPDVHVLVRRELRALRVDGPRVGSRRGRHRPRRVARDDVDPVKMREAAVLLGAAADDDARGRDPRAIAAGRAREVRGDAVDPLVQVGDRRREHTGTDAEVHPARIPRRRDRRAAIGVEDGHLPEDPVVLQPLRALDERADRDAIRARRRGRLDREPEPRDLSRPDVRRGLQRRPVVATVAVIRSPAQSDM